MIAHVQLAGSEGADLIRSGRAVCAMKGQRADYWPADPLDEELRALLVLDRLDREVSR